MTFDCTAQALPSNIRGGGGGTPPGGRGGGGGGGGLLPATDPSDVAESPLSSAAFEKYEIVRALLIQLL